MTWRRWIIAGVVLAATWLVGPEAGEESLLRALWPAVVAVGVIVLLRQAVLGLAAGVVAGALLLEGGNPLEALRLALVEHLFPSMQGPWRVGAVVFTLLLGAFAGVLERSGGLETLLRRAVSGGATGGKRLLGGVYGMGLLCFFDGLASSMLTGRIARPLTDRAGISRERLAWVVDTTASPIACVAFISTWIATQLSLIDQGLEGAPFAADPYGMFFRSVPANPYCLLCLLLVPLAIWRGYEPRAMRRFEAVEVREKGVRRAKPGRARTAVIPLVVLIFAIFAGFPLLAESTVNVLSVAGWRMAFSGDSGPYALVAGSLAGLVAALAFFPKGRGREAREAAVHGAGSLLPALVVLVLAWSLGSQFGALGAAGLIAEMLSGAGAAAWLPLAVFAVGSAMAFATGSSWGTMGILMPLALPAVLAAGAAEGLVAGDIQALAAMAIGAVFGGATLGDHCSPFSDTTIVSALASGCRTEDHVISQLPFAGMTALAAAAAYALMAAGAASWIGTALAAVALTVWVLILSGRGRRTSGAPPAGRAR